MSQYLRPDLELKAKLLAAARADDIPTGNAGLWKVTRYRLSSRLSTPKIVCAHDPLRHKWAERRGTRKQLEEVRCHMHYIPAGCYTQLWRYTLANHHKHQSSHGELIMQDTPQELNTHLHFMLEARGKVLITGLGLGCVARGCLANPAVDSVTVIERDPRVIQLVEPWLPRHPRLEVIRADALEWAAATDERFTCAWHDLWSDPDNEEPHLQLTHSNLITAFVPRTEFQGAWQLPRWFGHRLKHVL